MYRITSPGSPWMLATVGRIFTVPFFEMTLYRKKVTKPASSIGSFSRYQPIAAKRAFGECVNAGIQVTKFSLRNLAELVTICSRRGCGKEENDVLYSVRRVSDIDAMYYDTLWHTRRHVEIATTLQRRNFAEVLAPPKKAKLVPSLPGFSGCYAR